MSRETYVGYEEGQHIVNPTLTKNALAVSDSRRRSPSAGWRGRGVWTEGAQEATAGRTPGCNWAFWPDDVYLVMAWSGTGRVSINNTPTTTIQVAGVPKLYTLFQASSPATGDLSLSVPPGIQAYDFTFG